MKVMITCKTHNAPQIFLPGAVRYSMPDRTGELQMVEVEDETTTVLDIDEGSLYCTGGEGEHELEYSMTI